MFTGVPGFTKRSIDVDMLGSEDRMFQGRNLRCLVQKDVWFWLVFEFMKQVTFCQLLASNLLGLTGFGGFSRVPRKHSNCFKLLVHMVKKEVALLAKIVSQVDLVFKNGCSPSSACFFQGSCLFLSCDRTCTVCALKHVVEGYWMGVSGLCLNSSAYVFALERLGCLCFLVFL